MREKKMQTNNKRASQPAKMKRIFSVKTLWLSTALLLFSMAGLFVWATPVFEIKVPTAWTKQKVTAGSDTIHLYVHPSHDFYVRVRTYPIRSTYTLEKIKQIFEYRELRNSGLDYKLLIESKKTDKYKNLSLIIAYQAYIQGIPVKITTSIIKKGNMAYSAMVVIKEKMLQDQKDAFLKIVENFAIPR